MKPLKYSFRQIAFALSLGIITYADEAMQPDPSAFLVANATEADLLKIMKKNNVPGLAACIIKGDKIEKYLLGGAQVNAKGKVVKPIESDTLFCLASVSKIVTTSLIMKLVQEGVLNLDHNIADYLPSMPIFNGKGITLRMLLNHSASIQDNNKIAGNYENYNSESIPLNIFMPRYFDASKNGQFWNWTPGQKHEYSNFGPSLAGYVAQVKTGINFYQLSKEKVFQPLGITYSSFSWNEVKDKKLATPYLIESRRFKELQHLYFADYPSGTLRCSLDDAVKFFTMYMNSSKEDTPVLTKNSFDEVTRASSMETSTARKGAYAMGCFIYKENGKEYLYHEGEIEGTGAKFVFNKTDNFGIIMLTNCSYNDKAMEAFEKTLHQAAERL